MSRGELGAAPGAHGGPTAPAGGSWLQAGRGDAAGRTPGASFGGGFASRLGLAGAGGARTRRGSSAGLIPRLPPPAKGHLEPPISSFGGNASKLPESRWRGHLLALKGGGGAVPELSERRGGRPSGSGARAGSSGVLSLRAGDRGTWIPAAGRDRIESAPLTLWVRGGEGGDRFNP